MTHETVARARDILEIFAEAQAIVSGKTSRREAALVQVVKDRKAADNAEQHKNRQCDSDKHARRLEKKRAAYAAKRGGNVRAYRKAAA